MEKGFVNLSAACISYISDMVHAVKVAFQFSQRDDWINRKRGIDLITAIVSCFSKDKELAIYAVYDISFPLSHLSFYFKMVLLTHQETMLDLAHNARQDYVRCTFFPFLPHFIGSD